MTPRILTLFSLFVATAAASGCSKPKPKGPVVSDSPRFLYVASGLCQAGANTTYTSATSSNLVYRVNLSTGNRDMIIADYTPLTESPVGIVDYDSQFILVALEKTGSRRIEKVERRLNGNRSNFSTDSTAFSNTLLAMTKSKDGGVFVSRTNGIAAISPSGTTIAATYLAGTGGAAACGTTNTKYSSLSITAQGQLIYLNSENSDNKVAIAKTGPVCVAGNTPSTPTAATMTTSVFIPEANQLIVANAGTSAATGNNTLHVYDVTSEDASVPSATLSSPTKIYDSANYPSTESALLYAVSAMAWDAANGHLYIATANMINSNLPTAGALYVIEKFSYVPATKTLTRVGSMPFYPAGFDTKCISSMFVGY